VQGVILEAIFSGSGDLARVHSHDHIPARSWVLLGMSAQLVQHKLNFVMLVVAATIIPTRWVVMYVNNRLELLHCNVKP
jgi:hypothetical protein